MFSFKLGDLLLAHQLIGQFFHRAVGQRTIAKGKELAFTFERHWGANTEKQVGSFLFYQSFQVAMNIHVDYRSRVNGVGP